MVGDEKGVAPSCDHPRLQNPPDAASRHVARKLLLAGCLATIFMLGEAAGGYLAGSLAVMTDAAHMLSDVCSFAIGTCRFLFLFLFLYSLIAILFLFNSVFLEMLTWFNL